MNQLHAGAMLYGFCNGFFGRDSHQDKRVEAFGEDWIVARDKYGQVHFCSFPAPWMGERDRLIEEWMQKPEDDR